MAKSIRLFLVLLLDRMVTFFLLIHLKIYQRSLKFYFKTTIPAQKKEEDALKKQLAENDKAMKEMAQSYEEKLAAAKSQVYFVRKKFTKEKNLIFFFNLNLKKTGNLERTKIIEKSKTVPHIKNVNIDPSLSGAIIFLLEGEGPKTIGLAANSNIKLNGVGYVLIFNYVSIF